MAAAEIMDRLDELFQGLDPTVVRPLPNPLQKLHESAETPEEWYPGDNPAVRCGYLMLDGGDPGEFPSHKIGQSIEQVRLAFDLVAYCGGDLGVTQKRQELERTLGTTWEKIKSLLSWPGNLNRADTGWWANTAFSASSNVLRGDRLVKPCRFTVIYAYTHSEN